MTQSVNWDTYWLYVLTEAALSLSPGPAVMLVLAFGMTRGVRSALAATLGILSANAFYFSLSATGLGALLLASPTLFAALKWAGAAYLVSIGIRAFVGHASPISLSQSRTDRTAGAVYLAGLTLQLANPKTLIFFVAILPQFIDTRLALGAQMLWLAAGSVIPETFILAAYAYLASRAAGLAADPRYARWTDRCAGLLVLGAAALVLTIVR